MRILVAGQTYAPALNGQAIFTTNLAEGLHENGHSVLVAIPSLESTPYSTTRNGVQIEALRAIPLTFLHKWASFTPLPNRPVRRIFETFRPHLVHIQDHYPLCRAVVAAARRRNIPLVGTNHFLPENILPYLPLPEILHPIGERLLWMPALSLFNRLDQAVAPSKTAADILRQNGIEVPVRAISCGVDLDHFHPNGKSDALRYRAQFDLDPEATLLLFVGRIDEEKQLDLLLRALRILDRSDIHLAIVGRGEMSPKLHELRRSLGLEHRVHFTGPVSDEELVALLNVADIFAMPSEAELLSMATLEAMACGRPVLAARARALPELVNDGVNGYLFNPGDVKDAVRCIARLVDERDRWPIMSEASLQQARKHGLNHIIESYEALYGDVIGQRCPHPANSVRDSVG